MRANSRTTNACRGILLQLLFLVALTAASPKEAGASEDLLLRLSPDHGPIGTKVAISGQVPADQISEWTTQWADPGYFTLLLELSKSREFPSGCELLGFVDEGVVHLDPDTGQVSGSFRVPSRGTCFQSEDGKSHAIRPGQYYLSIGCHACVVASFTITGGLPRTGGALTAGLILSALLLACGAVLSIMSPRRRRRAA